MTTSSIQIIANRENAAKSTGPATPEGKRRSSLNATTHGLTSKVVCLPEEDREAYLALCREFAADLQPVGSLECNLVQTLADHQWRLRRAHAREFESDDLHELEQLTRHSARILRDFNTTLKSLQATQRERKKAEQTSSRIPLDTIDWGSIDIENGFVLSPEQPESDPTAEDAPPVSISPESGPPLLTKL